MRTNTTECNHEQGSTITATKEYNYSSKEGILKREITEIKGTITILMRMSKVAVFGGESYMCSSGFLQKYFIPSAKYQTATGILKRQKMFNKSYFSRAKKNKRN